MIGLVLLLSYFAKVLHIIFSAYSRSSSNSSSFPLSPQAAPCSGNLSTEPTANSTILPLNCCSVPPKSLPSHHDQPVRPNFYQDSTIYWPCNYPPNLLSLVAKAASGFGSSLKAIRWRSAGICHGFLGEYWSSSVSSGGATALVSVQKGIRSQKEEVAVWIRLFRGYWGRF